jgi:hypothetical protein
MDPKIVSLIRSVMTDVSIMEQSRAWIPRSPAIASVALALRVASVSVTHPAEESCVRDAAQFQDTAANEHVLGSAHVGTCSHQGLAACHLIAPDLSRLYVHLAHVSTSSYFAFEPPSGRGTRKQVLREVGS